MFICRTAPRMFTGRPNRSMNRSRLSFQPPVLPNPSADLWSPSVVRLTTQGPQRAPSTPSWPYRASLGVGMGRTPLSQNQRFALVHKDETLCQSGWTWRTLWCAGKIGTDGMSALLITAIQRPCIVLHSQRHATTPPTPVSWPRSIGRSPPGRSRQEPFPSNLLAGQMYPADEVLQHVFGTIPPGGFYCISSARLDSFFLRRRGRLSTPARGMSGRQIASLYAVSHTPAE